MKKIISTLLVISMLLSLSVTAFAATWGKKADAATGNVSISVQKLEYMDAKDSLNNSYWKQYDPLTMIGKNTKLRFYVSLNLADALDENGKLSYAKLHEHYDAYALKLTPSNMSLDNLYTLFAYDVKGNALKISENSLAADFSYSDGSYTAAGDMWRWVLARMNDANLSSLSGGQLMFMFTGTASDTVNVSVKACFARIPPKLRDADMQFSVNGRSYVVDYKANARCYTLTDETNDFFIEFYTGTDNLVTKLTINKAISAAQKIYLPTYREKLSAIKAAFAACDLNWTEHIGDDLAKANGKLADKNACVFEKVNSDGYWMYTTDYSTPASAIANTSLITAGDAIVGVMTTNKGTIKSANVLAQPTVALTDGNLTASEYQDFCTALKRMLSDIGFVWDGTVSQYMYQSEWQTFVGSSSVCASAVWVPEVIATEVPVTTVSEVPATGDFSALGYALLGAAFLCGIGVCVLRKRQRA